MSELKNTENAGRYVRWQLLTTVSTLTLLASISGIQQARAEDADRPTVWIELGADLERVDGGQQTFAPAFVVNNPGSTAFDPVSPAEAQKPPSFSFGGEAKLSIQPEGSNWIFSAAVRYGRANSTTKIHQTAKNEPLYEHVVFVGPHQSKYHELLAPQEITPFVANFLAVTAKQGESHAVVDFLAGKDVGLGLFGRSGSSVLNVGVRFAQFTSSMQSSIQARPDLKFPVVHFPTPVHTPWIGTAFDQTYHQYVATAESARSFRGIGPSLSWTASAPFVGNQESGDVSLDFGANAAVLFGRQKANVQHQTSAVGFACGPFSECAGTPGYDNPLVARRRSRTVIVPNVGGFAGLSIQRANAKISFGYRGDFFFGAMDTGFDTAKHSMVGFYGPFANISVGFP